MHATTSAISEHQDGRGELLGEVHGRVGLRRGELAAGLHLIARHPGQRRDRGGQRGLRRARRGARDDLVIARSAGDGKPGGRLEGGHRGVAELVVNAEVDGSDQAEGTDPPRVVDDLHRLAEPEMLVGGGGRVHGGLARAAGQVSGRDRETPQRRVGGDVDGDARQLPVPDDLAVAAHQRRPPHQASGGRIDPAGGADLGQHGRRYRRIVRAARTTGPWRMRGHGGVDVPGSGREAGEIRLIHRGAHHQGAGDEGDTETDREAGQYQPRGAIAQAGQGGPQHGPAHSPPSLR